MIREVARGLYNAS